MRQFIKIVASVEDTRDVTARIETLNAMELTEARDAFRLFAAVFQCLDANFIEYVMKVGASRGLDEREQEVIARFGAAIHYLTKEMQRAAGHVASISNGKVKP